MIFYDFVEDLFGYLYSLLVWMMFFIFRCCFWLIFGIFVVSVFGIKVFKLFDFENVFLV